MAVMSAEYIAEHLADDGLKAGISKLLLELETARRQRDRAIKERDQLQRTIDHYRQRLARERALNIRLAQAIGRGRKSSRSPSAQQTLNLESS